MRLIGAPPKQCLAMKGKLYPTFRSVVTAKMITDYATAISDRAPLRHDRKVAISAGYRDIVAPPTFGFTLALLADQSEIVLNDFGHTVNEALHGEQCFKYHHLICGGDLLNGVQKISDVYFRKAESMLFVITQTVLQNQFGDLVLEMAQTNIVLRESGKPKS